ncbi:leucine-rich repeat and IQ domain-containing protein 1-like [Carassius carassius]|uniref:leucine-rich repeat and IQ domain-containing protein 1-like n=1 Tax=Carassius carassius TaxID=217509 RepID=UPI002868A253|nr:leucine-rich repeat and IQ domain-containing protein 1-like [Carassius carassius]XP_059362634.1 leucine-rich repeat and IQ domain-containing protein 1-like [Carassius carassius]
MTIFYPLLMIGNPIGCLCSRTSLCPITDLQNVRLNLQKCTSLEKFNLTGNPLQLESNWRSLLLETVPGLIKLKNEQIAAAAVPHKCPEQQWSFQALCQAQQELRDSLLQQQKMEISSAPSQHDAQLLAIVQQADLLRMAVDQCYAHEYIDSCFTEDSTLAAAANSSSCTYSETSLSQEQRLEMCLWDTRLAETQKDSIFSR